MTNKFPCCVGAVGGEPNSENPSHCSTPPPTPPLSLTCHLHQAVTGQWWVVQVSNGLAAQLITSPKQGGVRQSTCSLVSPGLMSLGTEQVQGGVGSTGSHLEQTPGLTQLTALSNTCSSVMASMVHAPQSPLRGQHGSPGSFLSSW